MAEKKTTKTMCLHLLVLVAIFVGAEANDTNGATVNIDWVKGFRDSDARAISVEAGTELTFNWESNHNVAMLPSKKAFDTCDLSSAVSVGVETGVTYTVSETTYFVCAVPGHCFGGQKLAASVASLMVTADTMVTADSTNTTEDESAMVTTDTTDTAVATATSDTDNEEEETADTMVTTDSTNTTEDESTMVTTDTTDTAVATATSDTDNEEEEIADTMATADSTNSTEDESTMVTTDTTDTAVETTTSDTNDEEVEPEGGWPGGCYDMDIHVCGCQPGYCTKAMCEGNGRLWADGAGGSRGCPNLCDPEVCTDKAMDDGTMVMDVPQAPSESPTIQRGGCYDGTECSCGIDRCMQRDCEDLGFEWATIDQCTECAPVVCRAKRMEAASAAVTASSFLMSTFAVVAASVIATMV